MHKDAKVFPEMEQGSEEWHAARCGLLTASEMGLIVTPATLKVANNDKVRAHIYELAAQRISKYTEPTYVGEAMLRGHEDEITARDLYSEHIDPVIEMGFITRDIGGCVIGYSPDSVGLMGGFGTEHKSRMQKFQIETIVKNEVPKEHVMQVQTGLLVTGWEYIDYVSYSGGLPMWCIRCEPIPEVQDAIIKGALDFEEKVKNVIDTYYKNLKKVGGGIQTERRIDDLEGFV